jgi:hypothetical protein
MLALPGSLIQWIFWFFTGARLRASQENSQSLQVAQWNHMGRLKPVCVYQLRATCNATTEVT